MASIDKHGADTLYFIRHNMRQLPHGKKHGNKEIIPEQSKYNYSLLRRSETADEVNKYRQELENEIFKYNRKNLVRTVEYVITLPEDCPPEQERTFFEESLKYVVSTLPMGERCVLLAEVHKDEGEVQKDGKAITKKRPHMHIMAVPAVLDDKHEGYKYKLCADQLTKRSLLNMFHPKFQKWLDDAGIKATVHSGVTGGKNVSVAAMKQLTKKTGLTLSEVKQLQQKVKTLEAELEKTKKELEKERSKESTWGNTDSWEQSTEHESDDKEKEITW